MPSIDLFVILGVILILVSLGVLFLMPASRGRRVKKRKRGNPAKIREEDNKDWRAVSLKLEKYIQTLREEIEELQKAERIKERELIRKKEKNKKLQEKLAQERGWHDREQKDIDRNIKEVHRTRQEMIELEKDLDGEHSSRLKRERESKDLKRDFETLNEQKREGDSELIKVKVQAEQGRQEIRELKASNTELSKKHEDTTWVAKTEYDKLRRILKETEKELGKFRKVI